MIIGINGFKESGKSSVGAALEAQFGFTQYAFATKLKQSVAALLDCEVDRIDDYKISNASVAFLGRPMDFRVFLQRYGTESHRHIFGEDFWVDALFKEIPTDNRSNVCITDARFENELRAIRGVGGYNVRVVRPGVESDGHLSEQEPSPHLIDYVLNNDRSLIDLEVEVCNMVDMFILRQEG